MRLLLVLLALLSGLSLAEVTASSARAEVVGSAAGSVLVANAEQKAVAAHARAQRPTCRRRLIRTVVVPVLAFGRAISIEICDRPLE
jgi:hypothetical protein